MSKSSGEFLRLQLLIDKGYHPLAYRMMCLQAHYRSELEFSWEGLSAASRRLSRLVQNVRKIRPDSKFFALLRREYPENSPSKTGLNSRLLTILDHPIKRDLEQFERAICDDLNTSEALTVLERVVKNKRYKKRHKSLAIALMDEVLGLGLIRLTRRKLRTKNIRNNAPISVVNADIDGVINARRLLKRAGEYQLSDDLRRVLNDWGVEVMDGDPLGWEWRL